MFIGLFLLVACIFMLAWKKSVRGAQSFSTTYWLCWLGIFVWADALIIAPFWMIAALIGFFTKNTSLFGLIASLFWTIRGIGEVLYWFHEQFATQHRNPPSTLVGYRFFKDESIWFLYQITWQCLSVFSIILSLYFAHQWLG